MSNDIEADEDSIVQRELEEAAYRREAIEKLATAEELEELGPDELSPLPPSVLVEFGRIHDEGWRPDEVRFYWKLLKQADPSPDDACRLLRKLFRKLRKWEQGDDQAWRNHPERAFACFCAKLLAVARTDPGEWEILTEESGDS